MSSGANVGACGTVSSHRSLSSPSVPTSGAVPCHRFRGAAVTAMTVTGSPPRRGVVQRGRRPRPRLDETREEVSHHPQPHRRDRLSAIALRRDGQVIFPGAFRPRSDTWMLADAACRQPLRPGAAILRPAPVPAWRASPRPVRTGRGSRPWTSPGAQRSTPASTGGSTASVCGHCAATCSAPWATNASISSSPIRPTSPARRRRPEARRARRNAGADGRAVLDRICADVADHLVEGGVFLVVHSEVSAAATRPAGCSRPPAWRSTSRTARGDRSARSCGRDAQSWRPAVSSSRTSNWRK